MEENRSLNEIVGANLLKLRKSMKLTQLELAEKFNYSDKSISKWEKGESLPSVDVLYDLAEFYGVTLNDLVNKNADETIKANKKKTPKTPAPHIFPTHLMITLLSIGAVWFCATILFVVLKLCINTNYYMAFMWAGVLSCVVLIVFNSIWGKMPLLFPILTILLWLFLGSLHLQIYIPTGISTWPIYFLGIPLQVCIILWWALVKKPRSYYINKKQQKTEEK